MQYEEIIALLGIFALFNYTNGSILRQMGAFMWYAFLTLFHKDFSLLKRTNGIDIV